MTAWRTVDDDARVRICHVITRLILGGAQENTILTCEGLAARGHEVTLVTGPAIGPEGELMTRATAGDYRVIVLPAMRREIRPLRDRRVYHSLKRLLGEIKPDIVHTHSSKAGILARRAAAEVRRGPAAGGMKIVHTIHGLPFHSYETWWRNKLYIALERRAAERTDAIISVADAMTRQALSAGVGRAEQYTTIYSGMEVEPFLAPSPQADEFRGSLALPDDAVLVTQVSRLAELKGHEYLIEAACRLGEQVHFCLVGDGPLRRKIEKKISRRRLAGRFHIIGLVAPERIPAIMQASDIVVHCSLREGLARALPQAMLAGKPVVSFDIDGAREVVNEKTGVLLAPGDAEGLAEAIGRLAGSAQLRSDLSAAGRESCVDRFDHSRMVNQIEALYRRLR
ncbi:hypothetical protein LCGC14_0284150 [marine sediment metagenome]|uniref:Glycosyltransferase subfamily 4-like N-terminal domain-containing protein n=1 Tax=marine sediment metagenome TaxID=412755 RepID=A0A0F9TV42_9ZZZZ